MHPQVLPLLLLLLLPALQCEPDTLASCYTKLDKMKNIMQNLKLEQKRFGNVTIANMEVFYEMCIDTTSCIESIQLPDFLKGLMSFGTMFLRSACEEYGFKVGAFSKCIEKTKFDVSQLKNITIGQKTRKCELSDDEFSELEAIVKDSCDEDAWNDMMANEKRVRRILCAE